MAVSAGAALVIAPAWVGDLVMAQVLLRLLQQTRPGLDIDVLAPAATAPLLARMPEVRRAIALPVRHGELALRRRRQCADAVRAQGYAQAFVLPNSLKSALVPWLARIPLRTGWCGEWRYGLLNDLRRLDVAALPTMAQRFAALALAPGAPLPRQLPPPALRVDADAARALAAQFGLATDRPLLGLCPGAEFGGAKRWPADRYGELARLFVARGWQVLLFGAAGDSAVCRLVRQAAANHGRCVDLAGRTTLEQAVDLLSLCTAVVSNDSGLMHVAAALQRPLVAVYGATSPEFTPPLSARAAVLRPGIDCAPCGCRECPLGHHGCMLETTAGKVAATLDALLASVGAVT